ncbi:MAG: RAMP superfamily CRISPR-associated protein [archaeon]
MSDMIISGKITALEPLHIGTGVHIGTYQPTLDYIPARAIRGMLGNYLFSHNPQLYKELEFKNGHEKIYFRDGVPEGMVHAPSLLRVCKGCGKILGIKNECECGHESKELSGWIKKNFTIGEKVESAEVKKQINTKCPIAKEWHTTYPKGEGKTPYNVAAIGRGTKFDFRIVVEDKYVQPVKEALQEAGIFYGIGGMRSRGYGAVLFEFLKEETAEEYMELRIKTTDENCLLVVNSPVILRDNVGNCVIEIGNSFEDAAQISGQRHCFKEERIVLRTEYAKLRETLVRGWSIENGNKLNELYYGIAPGSCVVCKISPLLLACLEVYGMGEFTNVYGDVYFVELGKLLDTEEVKE